jgi:hypothetical protein
MKYRYALNPKNQLIDILDLPADLRARDKGPFHCLSCAGILIAKTRGKIRQKHFAHAAEVPCRPESYLHLLGKHVFIETFKAHQASQTPLTIHLPQTVVCTRP